MYVYFPYWLVSQESTILKYLNFKSLDRVEGISYTESESKSFSTSCVYSWVGYFSEAKFLHIKHPLRHLIASDQASTYGKGLNFPEGYNNARLINCAPKLLITYLKIYKEKKVATTTRRNNLPTYQHDVFNQ